MSGSIKGFHRLAPRYESAAAPRVPSAIHNAKSHGILAIEQIERALELERLAKVRCRVETGFKGAGAPGAPGATGVLIASTVIAR
jgi:hypothetical protein